MKRKFKLLTIVLIFILIFITLFIGYKFSKSRTHQFAGEIISQVDTQEKIIALTFDDGPTENTPDISEILDTYDVKASFFLTGKEIEQNMDLAKAIASHGHDIGNHTFSHQRMVFKSHLFIEDEINRTNGLIRQIGFDREIYFRAPYCKKLFTLPLILKEKNIIHVTWSIEPDTYLNADSSAEQITAYVLSNAKPGSIVLLHMMYENNRNNIQALPLIIEGLLEKDYQIVTLSEMIE